VRTVKRHGGPRQTSPTMVVRVPPPSKTPTTSSEGFRRACRSSPTTVGNGPFAGERGGEIVAGPLARDESTHDAVSGAVLLTQGPEPDGRDRSGDPVERGTGTSVHPHPSPLPRKERGPDRPAGLGSDRTSCDRGPSSRESPLSPWGRAGVRGTPAAEPGSSRSSRSSRRSRLDFGPLRPRTRGRRREAPGSARSIASPRVPPDAGRTVRRSIDLPTASARGLFVLT
jgi:hypothetical protein